MRFHRKCGDRVTLLNENSTAIRNFVEFNHGLIFSGEPLQDDVFFEVCIDRKVNVWNGSLEIGVTTLDPEFMELPATATKLRNTAWIMSGSAVLKDGVTLINSYGPELDTLQEGDCLGVMRTSKGELMFSINGRCLGIAARDLPKKLFTVIDLYGQCVQVSIMHTQTMRPIMETSLDQIEDPNNDDTLTSNEMEVTSLPADGTIKDRNDVYVPITCDVACALVAQDRLRFHPRCGILVKLSANNTTAERARPLDDYNNGVVMTHRPLYDNELFEIRIDRLVDKWSGSIEVGVTTHNPATVRFPSTMTNVDTGTIMMSGCKVLLNGHGTCMEYRNFNLDELREGDTVGMMRKSNKLHYFINGIDQGVATDKVEQQVWGVVDLYGMTVKVSIVDPCEYVDSNINNIPTILSYPLISNIPKPEVENGFKPRIDEDSLLFHTLRDSNVIIINDGKTAHRPNAFEFFNNGTIMTNRPLRTNELFQVRVDLVIPKWAGSIEIGVTQQSHSEIPFSFKASNAKGTWAMTGEDVIRDGAIIIPQYVRNLNRLVEGDTVGVMRTNMGILHFYVNGVDQGPAAFNIPENVYGIIDLYARVAQATIVDSYTPPFSPESPVSSESNATVYPEMCFHRVHGRNARLTHSRLTASRATVYSEFNDAVLFSSRPLRECDMFELRIDKMVDCWIGSLEIGVTAIRPEDLESHGGVCAIAGTATDLNWDTYILSGSAMMKDGECVRSGYPLDLDTLTVGSRIGMMWHSDRSLHYYLDGMDMGKAWYVPHLNIYAVVDLYGQCTQVTILQNEERSFNYNGCTNSDNSALSNSRTLISPPPPYGSFSEYCGDNIFLMKDNLIAYRITADPVNALVFSSAHLAVEEMFEIKIFERKNSKAGSFRIGVTDINILNAHVNRSLPPSVAFLPHFTAYIDGKYVKYSQSGSWEQDIKSFVPSLHWLRSGDIVGLKKTNNGKVLVYYNSELLEFAFEKVPDKVYVVMEISGHVTKIQAISRSNNNNGTVTQPTVIANDYAEKNAHPNDTVTCEEAEQAEENHQIDSEPNSKLTNILTTDVHPITAFANESRKRRPYAFHFVHGNNIKLCSSDTVAVRTSGYKDGIAIVSQPIKRGQNFRFRVDKIVDSWQGGMSIGAVGALPNEPLPQCATYLNSQAWVLSNDILNDYGTCTKDHMANALDRVSEQSVLTIQFRFNGDLVIHIDGKIIGVIGSVPRMYAHVFPLVDLYGKVSQVSVLLHPYVVNGGTSLDLPIISENLTEESLAELKSLENKLPKDAEKSCRTPVKTKFRTYSHENLVENVSNSIIVQPGPSHEPSSLPIESDLKNNEHIWHNNQERSALHHSLILSSNTCPNSSTPLARSHSTHNFRSTTASDNTVQDNRKVSVVNSNRNCPETSDQAVASNDRFCDTNIQHNHRYREANEVDHQYNVFINKLIQQTHTHSTPCFPERANGGQEPIETLCAENLEQEFIDIEGSDNFNNEREFNENPRDTNADIQQKVCLENANYFRSLLRVDSRITDGQSFEAEWEAPGERCEHLHFALKYWNSLVQQHSELGQVLSRGQVRCFCNNCSGGVVTRVTGWVRIERADVPSTSRRAFWQVDRHILQVAQSPEATTTAVKRPKVLQTDFPNSLLYQLVDKWDDEEGKPQHMILVVEVDTDETNPENDRLLAFLIYLKAHELWRFPRQSNSSSDDEDD